MKFNLLSYVWHYILEGIEQTSVQSIQIIQGIKELLSRLTATRYLDELHTLGILHKEKIWKDNYYINSDLFHLLANVHPIE